MLNFWQRVYVSGKLGPGGGGEHTLKLKMVMTLLFQILTGNKFALKHVCPICMCNKITKLVYFNNLLCLVL